jgi:hypothetical protein
MCRVCLAGLLTAAAVAGLLMAGGEDCPAFINLTGLAIFAGAVTAGGLIYGND